MQFGMYMTHIAIMFLLRSSARQYSQPAGVAAVRLAVRHDRLQLRGVHRRVLGGIVAEPGVPDRDPHEADARRSRRRSSATT